MIRCHRAHGHDRDHAHDDHDCVSGTRNGLSVSLSGLNAHPSDLSEHESLSALRESGGCESGLHGNGFLELHGCFGAGQHSPAPISALSVHGCSFPNSCIQTHMLRIRHAHTDDQGQQYRASLHCANRAQ